MNIDLEIYVYVFNRFLRDDMFYFWRKVYVKIIMYVFFL